jgi:hypothetical protein
MKDEHLFIFVVHTVRGDDDRIEKEILGLIGDQLLSR